MRATSSALLAAVMALTGLTAVAPAQAAPGKAQKEQVTPAQLVAQLPVSPPLYVGYRGSEQFIPKAVANKRDKNGCNLRQRMIIQLAQKKPKVTKGCKMTGGRWLVDGGTKTVTKPAGLLLAPVMSYKDAWGSGAYAWTPAQRLAWATNTSSAPSTMRSKGVTIQQATQALYSPGEFLRIRSYLSSVQMDRTKRILLDQILAACAPADISCFIAASFTAQLLVGSQSYFEDQEYENQRRLQEACEALGRYAANVRAWGLSVDTKTHLLLVEALALCKYTPNVNVTELFSVYGIAPARATTTVPSIVDPDTGATTGTVPAPFDGYAAPITPHVASSQFGIIAPVDWGAPGVPTGYIRLWDSNVSWRDIETSKGVYDWRTLDASIQMAQSIGASVMYVLGNTPGWANGGAGANVPPTNLADAANFIRSVCTRYQGSIRSYQAWNEGNLTTFWTGSQDQLGELTKLVKDAVKGCFPSADVIAASTGTRASGPFATNFPQYLDALKARGWPVDGYSVHTYPAANGGPSERVNELAQFKTMLAVKEAPVRPIYDTELNYGLAGLGQDRVPLDPERGAAYLATSFIQSVQYGVDSTVWFLWTQSEYDKLGIQLNPDTPVTVTAWRTIHNWLVGSRMQRCAMQGGLHACQITSADGSNATLMWTEGETVTVNVQSLGSTVCALNGSCTPVNGPLTIGVSPVRVS